MLQVHIHMSNSVSQHYDYDLALTLGI